MNDTQNEPSQNRLLRLILMVGPGIFCVGYTIGTGSVTAMAKAGSEYGMQLLWVLALSCFFWLFHKVGGESSDIEKAQPFEV